MFAAAVGSAGVTTFTMFVVVVAALYVGVKFKIVGKECLDRFITGATDTAVKVDAGFGKSRLRTAANASADENVRTELLEHGCKCAMSFAIGINDCCVDDLSFFYLINLKLRGMTEMLKDLFVLISDCNFHTMISFSEILNLDRLSAGQITKRRYILPHESVLFLSCTMTGVKKGGGRGKFFRRRDELIV